MRAVGLFLLALVVLAGCAGGTAEVRRAPSGSEERFELRTARLTEAQACAIGYDLAREIHARVSLRRTVILAPRRATGCERHALEYLRRAGFRIDETGSGGVAFDVRIDAVNARDVSAVASIGSALQITRVYTPVETGAIAASAISVQTLDPDTLIARAGAAS